MSLAEANRKYFDAITDSYDRKPWWAKVNQQVTDVVRSRLDWIGIPFANTGSSASAKEVCLLDYACGPGLWSRIFGPYVTVTRGIDISPNMVARYNAQARAANLPPETINAVVGDLFDKSNPNPKEFSGPEWQGFDLATVGFGFHHFEDVVHASKCLKNRLRPGGVLVISDFLEGGDLKADENGGPIPNSEGDHTGHFHAHHHGHHHNHHHGHGHNREHKPQDPMDEEAMRRNRDASIVVPHFTVDGVRKFFTEAGFIDVDVVTMDEKVYMEFQELKVWRTVLFAKGRKPEAEQKSEL